MIHINKLRHYYASKQGESVKALDDVSCVFPDRGLYFVVGKSGSGKSTLLNVLGGLDKIQSGDLLVDGTSFRAFKQSDYDKYRSSYVGVIFQEFNLINEINIHDNLELQLNIAGNKDAGALISRTLSQVGLSGYEKRYPNELSGGEKQRVAIARQIAKGAKLLLADEPTGNLDSENTKNIFSLLKEIAKDILVIIVSHDVESAQTYGHGSIELKDGKIINDSINSSLSISKQHLELTKKSKFPVKYYSKFARKNIFNRKIRFSVALLLSSISLMLLCVFGSILGYSFENGLANSLLKNGVKHVNLVQGMVEMTDSNFGFILDDRGNNLSPSFISEFDQSYQTKYNYYKITSDDNRFSLGSIYHSTKIAQIASSDDIRFLGYDMLEGYQSLTDDSVYITDFYANALIREHCIYVNGDSEQVEIPSSMTMRDLVGKVVLTNNTSNATVIKIAGIIKTDSDRFSYVSGAGDFSTDYNESLDYKDSIYNVIYANEAYILGIIIAGDNFFYNEYSEVRINDKAMVVANFRNTANLINGYGQNGVVLTDASMYSEVALLPKLGEDDCIISLATYNSLFGDNRNTNYYIQYVEDGKYGEFVVMHYPEHIGESISLSITSQADDGLEYQKSYNIIGVYIIDAMSSSHGIAELYLSDENYNDLAIGSELLYTNIIFDISSMSEKELAGILTYLLGSEKIAISAYTYPTLSIKFNFMGLRYFFVVISGIILLVAAILFVNFISTTISDKRKDIGIIRALGGTSKSVFLIFFTLGLVFTILSSLLSFGLYGILNSVFNAYLAKGVLAGVTLLRFNFLMLPVIPIISIIVMLLSSIVPIVRITRKSPIDAIKSE
jgi:ABC-type lipoprotein export system ATPase subunit/ABC-type lipoprotein release transport system permease subunit